MIGGLHVEDYVRGGHDYDAGTPPPRVTSVSYDLGRRRAAERAEAKADVLANIKAEQERSHAAIRKMLVHRPDLLAEFDARMAAIEARHGAATRIAPTGRARTPALIAPSPVGARVRR